MKKAQKKGKRTRGKPGRRGGKRSTSWTKGKAPKSPGRPPLPEDYKTFLNDQLGPKGLAALDAILDDPEHPRHEQAAEYVVNRWKGTPTAKTEIAGPGGGPIPVTTEPTSGEKRARALALLARAAARVAAGAATAAAGETPAETDEDDGDPAAD